MEEAISDLEVKLFSMKKSNYSLCIVVKKGQSEVILYCLLSSIISFMIYMCSVIRNKFCHQFPVLLVNAPFLKLFKDNFVKYSFIFLKALNFKYMILSTLAGKEFYKYI